MMAAWASAKMGAAAPLSQRPDREAALAVRLAAAQPRDDDVAAAQHVDRERIRLTQRGVEVADRLTHTSMEGGSMLSALTAVAVIAKSHPPCRQVTTLTELAETPGSDWPGVVVIAGVSIIGPAFNRDQPVRARAAPGRTWPRSAPNPETNAMLLRLRRARNAAAARRGRCRRRLLWRRDR